VYGRDERGRQVYALTYGQYGDTSFAVMTDAVGKTVTFTFEDLVLILVILHRFRHQDYLHSLVM
jgi:hypothetical protein